MSSEKESGTGGATGTRTDGTRATETASSTAPSPRTKKSVPGGTATGTARNAPPHVQPRRAERRPEMIRQRREERRQAYERQRRQWLLTRIGLGAFAVLVVVGIGYGVFRYVQNRRPSHAPQGTLSFQ